MQTYEKLKKEFDEKVENLKKNCTHNKLSVWCEEWWAIGHETGFQVKNCKICSKIIKRRIKCFKCGNWIEDYVNGDGKKRPMGEYYCKKCDSEEKFK